jgi:hypothetical protein
MADQAPYVSENNRCMVKTDLLCFEEGQVCQDFIVFDCSRDTILALEAKTPLAMFDPFIEPELDDNGDPIMTLDAREITFGQDEKRCLVARVCWTGGGGGAGAKSGTCEISGTNAPTSYGIRSNCTKTLALNVPFVDVTAYVVTESGKSEAVGNRGFSRNGQEVACDRNVGSQRICRTLCMPKAYLDDMVPVNLEEQGVNQTVRRKDAWQLLVGKVNDAPWCGYDTAQVQFDGASVREDPEDDNQCIVTFCFLIDWASVVTYPMMLASGSASTDLCGCGGSTPIPIVVTTDVSLDRDPWDCVQVDTFISESVGAASAGEIAGLILALLFGLPPCLVSLTIARSMCVSEVAERENFDAYFPTELCPLNQHTP